jgi:hypothetical protein
MKSSVRKIPKVDLDKPTNKLRPQLYTYLSSVSHHIDGRSYQKFLDIFAHSKKPKLIKTDEALKKQVETSSSKLITVKRINKKPKKEKEYLLNVMFYSDQPQHKDQKPATSRN